MSKQHRSLFLPCRIALAVAALASASALLTACGGESCDVVYPNAPAGAAALLHVASCGSSGGDGSPESPYATVSAALEAAEATPGAAVLVAPGTYAENLVVRSDVTIVGSNAPDNPDDAAIILQAPQPFAVRVENGSTATLTGVRVESSVGVGVWVLEGASLTLSGSVVSGVAKDADGVGYGVLATDDGAIILQHTDVSGAAVHGVEIAEAKGIILQSTMRDNGGAGLRIERATDQVKVEGSEVLGNTQSGVAVVNSRAIILQSTLSGTRPDSQGIADGLLATGSPGVDPVAFPTEVELIESTVSDNARTGVLISGAVTRTIILQNNTISSNADTGSNRVGSGVWIQGGAGSAPESVIEGNTITENRYLGVCLRGDTHGIILQNNQISFTIKAEGVFEGELGLLEVGDGIQILAGASAQILGNEISGNGRVGLLLDEALGAETVIDDNTFSTNVDYGVALQSTADAPPTASNTFQSNMLGDVNPASSYNVLQQDLASP
jgi:parallel beta-helix repeat protein